MHTWRIFLWISLIVCSISCSLMAQSPVRRVQGKVFNHQNVPVEAALVFITKDSSDVPLQFTQTDQVGHFVLEVEYDSACWINVRFLGFEPYKHLVSPNDSIGLRVELIQAPYDLNEVVIKEKAPAIVEKSDTLKYNLKYFRDSSEYNVEDLLRKLPGIQINNNGSIMVNGKALSKVLVEGEDVFGGKYTIGTRNMRALTIDAVEVIDHHQENPVLKGVKHSEDIVLNLKFSKNTKQSLGGALELGLGAGHEAKYELHSNLFSLANKSKFYWLNSFGNTGTQYSPEEMDATYGSSDSGYKLESPFTNIYLNPTNIDNPGLSAPFVNNSITNFSTLRSIFNLNKNWKLKLNTTMSNLKDKQYTEYGQTFLLDADLYGIRTTQQRQIGIFSGQGEAQLIQTNPDATRSFFSNITWNTSENQGIQAINQYFKNQNKNLASDQRISLGELAISGVFSQKIKKNSVSQLQFNYFNGFSRQHLQGQNLALARFWQLDSSLTYFSESIQTPYQEGNLFLRQIWAWNHLNLELESKAIAGQSTLDVHLALSQQPNDSLARIFLTENPSKIGQQALQQVIKLNGVIWKKNEYSVQGQLGTQQFFPNLGSRLNLNYAKVLTQFSHHFSDGGTASLSYQYAQRPISTQALLQSYYLIDAYNLRYKNPQAFSSAGQRLTIFYNRRNNESFLFHYFTLIADFNTRGWQDSLYFFNSLQVAQPYFTKGNYNAWASFRLEKFFSQLKLNFKIGLVVNQSKQIIGVANNNTPLFGQGIKAIADFTKSLGDHFKINFDQEFELNENYSNIPQWGRNQLFKWRLNLGPYWQNKQWLVALRFNRNFFVVNHQQKIDLISTSLKIRKNLMIRKNNNYHLTLDIYNLQNTKQFKSTFKSDYFLYQSVVEAIPAFAVLKIDIPL